MRDVWGAIRELHGHKVMACYAPRQARPSGSSSTPRPSDGKVARTDVLVGRDWEQGDRWWRQEGVLRDVATDLCHRLLQVIPYTALLP